MTAGFPLWLCLEAQDLQQSTGFSLQRFVRACRSFGRYDPKVQSGIFIKQQEQLLYPGTVAA